MLRNSSGPGLARRTAQAQPGPGAALFEPLRRLQGEQAATTFSQLVTPPRGARHDVVEGQIAPRAAILAAELVPQEQIEAREGHALLRFDVILEHHDGRDPDLRARAAHHLLVFGDDIDPLEPRGLHRFLPGPERKRIVGQRPVIRVQNQRRMMLQRARTSREFRSEVFPTSIHYRAFNHDSYPALSALLRTRDLGAPQGIPTPALEATIYRGERLTSP